MRSGAANRPASVTHRGLHPTGQLGQQDLARRERGEPRDVVRADRLVAEDGAGDPDDLVVGPGGVEHRLGGAGLVIPERDRGRTDEQRAEGLADRVAGGDPQQPVLDDAVGHVLLAQGAPDLGDLLDLEAPVLGDDHRPGGGEFLAQLGDGLPFGLCGHVALLSFGTRPACAVGARSVDRAGPCDVPDRLPQKADPNSQERGPPEGGAAGLPRRARRRPRSSLGAVRSGGSSLDRRGPSGPARSAGAGCLWRDVCMVRRRASRPPPWLVTGDTPVVTA